MGCCRGRGGAAGCQCAVEGGANVTVTGTGAGGDPFVVNASGEVSDTIVQGSDTATIDVTVIGDGTGGNPYIVSADLIGGASEWFTGEGAPAGGLGADGDLYLNELNGDVYQKAGGVWSVVANITGPAGAEGPAGSPGDPGPAGLGYSVASFSVGTLIVAAGTFRWPVTFTGTIVAVRAMLGTPATGSSVILDPNLNGVTIYTTQANRPTIAAGANDSGQSTNMDVTAVVAGDYLSCDVDQVGATTPGRDLTVCVLINRTA